MAAINFKVTGSFDKTETYLHKLQKADFLAILEKYGAEGVRSLANVTPIDSGTTRDAWSYDVVHRFGSSQLIFYNENVEEGRPVAILIQYGHGTRNGGYVEGRDYINPVILPLFDKIANDVWKAVTK